MGIVTWNRLRKIRTAFLGFSGAVGFVFVLAIFCECFVLRGVFVPLRISGSSMAPTLLGRHFTVTCPHCGERFPLDAEPLCSEDVPSTSEDVPYSDAVRCGECGERIEGLSDSRRTATYLGSRVLLDRTAFWRRSPQRFELVALRYPGSTEKLCVKRIVGLPGETLQFVDGVLTIQGERYVPTAAERNRLPRIAIPKFPLVTDRGSTDELVYLRTHAPNIAENVKPIPPDRVIIDSTGREWRSIIFRNPLGWIEDHGFREPVTLGTDEYFVVGDNQLLSEDSRSWKTSIRRSDLCGVVIPFPRNESTAER